MNRKIKVLLVGLGSEIGSTLISLIKNKKEVIEISGVITNQIFKNDQKKNFDSIITRIVLNDPSMINQVSYNQKNSSLIINKKKIRVFWGNVKKMSLSKIKFKYDVTIIATSKDQINDKNLMKKFLKVSKFVFGVAESTNLPSIYPNLINTQSKLFEKRPRNIFKIKDKVFALGSCQTNGWQSQLRLIVEIFNKIKIKNLKMLGCELDIVHPDTPQGKLGTKSVNPRDQDARNNLRPGFSQVEKSMKKIFKFAYVKNTISLRTLTSPPGYQISRFYISYSTINGADISKEYFKKEIIKFCKKNKFKIQYTDSTLGSRAFEKVETSAVLLLNDKYFHFNNNFLNIKKDNEKVLQIVFQSYVHNTRGYCRSVIEGVKEILSRFKRNKNISCWN
tara:strand:- start:243 stop:1415 length:1173 start_codon:yes stop_codon:yes gene_type:complete